MAGPAVRGIDRSSRRMLFATIMVSFSLLTMTPATEAFGAGGLLPPRLTAAFSSRLPAFTARYAASPLSLAMRKDGMSQAPSERRKKQSKWEDMPENIPRYEYVGGGFESAAPREEAAANSSMYKAFDSALRAADYNMFCAPLKKVETPSAFKAAKEARKGSAGPASQEFVEEEAEDPEEVAKRVAAEYAEFDRLVIGSAIESDGSHRRLKQKGSGTKTRVRNKPKTRAADEGAVAEKAASEAPRGRTKERKGGLEVLGGLAEELKKGPEDGLESYSYSEEGSKVSEAAVEEGYDELQAMLGLKPKPGSRTKLNNAFLRGNTTQLRQDGMFKKVTLKDPLKRVYAQRLLGLEPDIGSETAVARGKSPLSRDDKEEDKREDKGVNVADFLDGLKEESDAPIYAVPPRSPSNAKSPKKGRKGGSAKAKKPAAKPETAEEGGRLVMNHSTHIDGLIPVLKRLAETRGISTIVPGRLSKAQGRAPNLALRVSGPHEGGFKLLARHGTQCQEVFVVCDLERETLEGAIAWSL